MLWFILNMCNSLLLNSRGRENSPGTNSLLSSQRWIAMEEESLVKSSLPCIRVMPVNSVASSLSEGFLPLHSGSPVLENVMSGRAAAPHILSPTEANSQGLMAGSQWLLFMIFTLRVQRTFWLGAIYLIPSGSSSCR